MGYAKPGRRIYEKKYYSSLLNTEVVKEKALCYTLHHMRVDNGSASCYTYLHHNQYYILCCSFGLASE